MGDGGTAMSSAAPPPPTGVLRGHSSEVTAARFVHADGAGLPLILSADADGELRMWSSRTHRAVATAAAHSKAVLSVHALEDGKVLSQGRDGYVRVWDATSGLRPIFSFAVDSYSFCHCAPSPSLRVDGSMAATEPPESSTVEQMAAATQPPPATQVPLEQPPSATATELLSAPLLAAPSVDAQTILVWDLRQSAPAVRLQPPKPSSGSSGGGGLIGPRVGMVMCMRFLPFMGSASSAELVTGWEDGSLHSFDLRSANVLGSAKLHTEPLLCLDIHPKGGLAVTGAADCAVSVVRLGAPRGDDGDSSRGSDGGHGGVSTRNLSLETQLSIPETHEGQGSGGISSIRIRPDGKLMVAGGWDRRLRVWQVRNWKPLAVLRQHSATVGTQRCPRPRPRPRPRSHPVLALMPPHHTTPHPATSLSLPLVHLAVSLSVPDCAMQYVNYQSNPSSLHRR